MRAKRIGPSLNLINQVCAPHDRVKLIDVGRTQRYWNMVPEACLESRRVSITLVNHAPVQAPLSARFTWKEPMNAV